MSKKLFIGLFVILALCLSQTAMVAAADTKAPAAAKAEQAKAPMHHRAANMVAVCGCGKVFTPNASTKYVEYEGKSYACCSDPCHEMAAKDPAAAAKMAEEHMAKMMAPAPAPDKK